MPVGPGWRRSQGKDERAAKHRHGAAGHRPASVDRGEPLGESHSIGFLLKLGLAQPSLRAGNPAVELVLGCKGNLISPDQQGVERAAYELGLDVRDALALVSGLSKWSLEEVLARPVEEVVGFRRYRWDLRLVGQNGLEREVEQRRGRFAVKPSVRCLARCR